LSREEIREEMVACYKFHQAAQDNFMFMWTVAKLAERNPESIVGQRSRFEWQRRLLDIADQDFRKAFWLAEEVAVKGLRATEGSDEFYPESKALSRMDTQWKLPIEACTILPVLPERKAQAKLPERKEEVQAASPVKAHLPEVFCLVPRSAVEEVLVLQEVTQREMVQDVKRCHALAEKALRGELEPQNFGSACYTSAGRAGEALLQFTKQCQMTFGSDRGPSPYCMSVSEIAEWAQAARMAELVPGPVRMVGPESETLVLTRKECIRAARACHTWRADNVGRIRLPVDAGEVVRIKGDLALEKLSPCLAQLAEATAQAESLKARLWLVAEMGINWAEVEAAALARMGGCRSPAIGG
jgi:hypothetical protein